MARRKKRKIKIYYGRIVTVLLILGIVIYSLYLLVMKMMGESHQIHRVDFGTLDLEDTMEMLVIRNEMLVNTELEGSVNYLVEENTFVIQGTPVLEIYNDGKRPINDTMTPNALMRSEVEFDYNALQYRIDHIRNEIFLAIEMENYSKVPGLKEELTLQLERLEKIREDHIFLTHRLPHYSQQTVGAGQLAYGQRKALFSPASGLLSYAIDGYETYLHINQLYYLSFKDIFQNKNHTVQPRVDYARAQIPLFKVVDQASYYLVGLMSRELMLTYEREQNVKVRIKGDEIEGVVHDVFVEGDEAVLVLRMNRPFDRFEKTRFLQVDVVRDNSRGLVIPRDAIVYQSGETGVLMIDSNRRLKFMPIKELLVTPDYMIVYHDRFFDSEKGMIRTLKLGDQIIRNAHLYQEGDRIDE